MYLAKYLNKNFKFDGFILVDAYGKEHLIGKPIKKTPVRIKLRDKSLHYKLLLFPDLYFGEAYTNGSVTLENGSITELLEIVLKNIGRGDANFFNKITNKARGTYRFLTNFNIKKK